MRVHVGQGRWGNVYSETRNGTMVAVKRVDAKNEVAKRCAMNEIGILKSLHHEHIIDILESSCSDDVVEMVLEWGCDDLFVIRNSFHLTSNDIQHIFVQIASALNYLHESFVVHRDIKLENVMLKNGSVKLIDFGLAHAFRCEKNRLVMSACGSKAYVAPEVFSAPQPFDAYAADVWSLGILLFCLLMNHFPFEDADSARFKKVESLQRMGIRPAKACMHLYGKKADDYMCTSEQEAIDSMLAVAADKRKQMTDIVRMTYCAVV